MTKHDEGRRAFLVGSAAGAAASVTLVPHARAQDQLRDAAKTAAKSAATTAAPSAAADTTASDITAATYRHGAFFNNDDAKTVAALAERIMPSAPGKPGAADAGVLNYIDISLSGAYSDQQDFYRRGLEQLDAHCAAAYGKPFRQLGPQQQDECIGALAQDKAPEFVWPAARVFFATLRTHTMEGMFSDPVYGGNKDFAGWRLVGFPGAQPIFTPEDLSSKEAFSREPITGLQQQLKSKRS
jgi:gluconate 2-dehydrogenase gamma chain